MMLYALSTALYAAAVVNAGLFGSFITVSMIKKSEKITQQKLDHHSRRYLVITIASFVAGAVAGWFA